jgi:hypothetical protein
VNPFLYNSAELPSDKETLQAMVLELQAGRDQEKKRAEQLQVQNLRLQLELERYK